VCLVGHEHADHSKAAPDLMRAGINCYMSAGTAEALGLNGHRVRVVKALEQFTLGAWTVLPFEAIHDAREPLGFLVAGKARDPLPDRHGLLPVPLYGG